MNEITYTLKKYGLKKVNKTTNKLSDIIKLGKDVTKKEDVSNIVYKIDSADCKATYTVQSCRQLKTRLNEHKRDVTHC